VSTQQPASEPAADGPGWLGTRQGGHSFVASDASYHRRVRQMVPNPVERPVATDPACRMAKAMARIFNQSPRLPRKSAHLQADGAISRDCGSIAESRMRPPAECRRGPSGVFCVSRRGGAPPRDRSAPRRSSQAALHDRASPRSWRDGEPPLRDHHPGVPPGRTPTRRRLDRFRVETTD
jgi:hypothetical protein